MPDTFGGKPALEWCGSPCFAELFIVKTFRAEGWEARWVETFGAPAVSPRFLLDWSLNGLKACINEGIAEARVANRLDAVMRENRQTYAGCWDVVAWADDVIAFAEAKGPDDELRETQVRWMASALKHGFSAEAFLLVEWSPS